MENVVIVICIILSIIILKIILNVNLKKAKSFEKDAELEKITNKFPENIEIAKEILSMLKKDDVKIEEAKNTSTSLYIVATNKISIADMKENYARIQTIAHECLHSIQDRNLLLFNFIFSNIAIIYFITIAILTFFNKIQNTMLQIFILSLMAIIKITIRGYLEIDAMTKAKYLSEKYIKSKGLIDEEEAKQLLNKYDEINKIGIPGTLFYIVMESLITIAIYALIAI